MINEHFEIDITIHEEIDGMIAQKFNDGINNIILIWVYLDLEGKVVYLLKKSTKLQRSKNPAKEYNSKYNILTQD